MPLYKDKLTHVHKEYDLPTDSDGNRIIDLDAIVPSVTYNDILGGGPDDNRIGGFPTGCKKTLQCPEWANPGELSHALWHDQYTPETKTRIGYEDPWTFYTLNQIHMTYGPVDEVGSVVSQGQAAGRKILSSHTEVGVSNTVIDTAPGRLGGILQPPIRHGELPETYIPKNVFNMFDYGVKGNNTFFVNLTWYPRADPHETYLGVYNKINSGDGNGDYNEGLGSKYHFLAGPTQSRYTWIPQLSRATGFVGGYFWYTMKHLGGSDNITGAYYDIGVGKDGIGTFFNFTGEESKICPGPGEPLISVIQNSSGLSYTGHNFSGTGGVDFNWNREDFTTGNFPKYLEDITNTDAPEGKFAPSTGIVDVVARFFEKKPPYGFYSGKMNWPICQDPMVARPAVIQIKHENVHRGTSHSALFIEPVTPETAWDFDFHSFQSGDGVIGVHSGFTPGVQDSSTALYDTDYQYLDYREARRRGNGVKKYHLPPGGPLDPSFAGTDGWYPISYFYHNNCVTNLEFEEVYEYAPTKDWRTYATGDFEKGGLQNAWSDHFLAAPFTNYTNYSPPGGWGAISNYGIVNNSISKYTYIPLISQIPNTDGLGVMYNENHNVRPNHTSKACGHRFISGMMSSGTMTNPEMDTSVLSFTRSRRTIPSGGMDGRSDYYVPIVAAVETGEIVSPRFELYNEHGDLYRFHLSGWANYVFPPDESKDAQFITGFSYTVQKVDQIKPNIKKWFCPSQMSSLQSAQESLIQTVDIPSPLTRPDVFHYKINVINDSEGEIDGSVGPYISIYNEKPEDISSVTPPSSFARINLGVGFKEGSYDLWAGDRISSLIYYGKIFDGLESSFNTMQYVGDDCQIEGAFPDGDMPQEVCIWSTGQVGYHNQSECGLGGKSGLAQTPNASDHPVISEYNRREGEYVRAEGFGVDFTSFSPTGGASSNKYPNSSIEAGSDIKEIDLFLSHPNRGFVFFDVDNLFLGSNGESGVDRNDVGENFLLSIGKPSGTVITSEGYDEDDNPIVRECTYNGYVNYRFVREWSIFPNVPSGELLAGQTFSMPYLDVWFEAADTCVGSNTSATGGSPTSPAYAWASHPGCSGENINCIDTPPKPWNTGAMDYDGGAWWSGERGVGMVDASGIRRGFWPPGSSPDTPIYDERLHVHSVSKLWCPVVFWATTGEAHGSYGIDEERAFDVPTSQMPFSNDQGKRCAQDWPVVTEWFNYNNFHGRENNDRTTVHYWHEDEPRQGTTRKNHKDIRSLDDGMSDDPEQQHIFGDLEGDPMKLPFALTRGECDARYTPHPTVEMWGAKTEGSDLWGGATSRGIQHFKLNLASGITYKVVERSYAYAYHAFASGRDEGPYGGGVNPLPYEICPTITLINTREGYFQTNGSRYLDNGDNFKGDALDRVGCAAHDSSTTGGKHCGDDNYSGWISYAETLDQNISTFNVRTRNGCDAFVDSASNSLNCDGKPTGAGGVFDINKTIMIPSWNLTKFGTGSGDTTSGTWYPKDESGNYILGSGIPFEKNKPGERQKSVLMDVGDWSKNEESHRHDYEGWPLGHTNEAIATAKNEKSSSHRHHDSRIIISEILNYNPKAREDDAYQLVTSKTGTIELYSTLTLGDFGTLKPADKEGTYQPSNDSWVPSIYAEYGNKLNSGVMTRRS